MSISRYEGKEVASNTDQFYLELRDKKIIYQYRTGTLQHPTPAQIMQLQLTGHVWKVGDRYYKLAHEHYGDSRLWWVIAWFNRAPTEGHLKLGDTIQIPHPIAKIVSFYEL